MGQQNSCKTLIGVHSTMTPIKVLQLLHVYIGVYVCMHAHVHTLYSRLPFQEEEAFDSLPLQFSTSSTLTCTVTVHYTCAYNY